MKLNGLVLILFLLSGCQSISPEEIIINKRIQTIRAGEEVQTMTPLQGGKSKSKLFLVTSSSGHKYVARFFPHESQDRREKIIKAQRIASQQGYGPFVSYASPSDALILMDYLEQDSPNTQHTPETMASLLKTIHQGPQFQSSWTLWDRMEQNLKIIDSRQQQLFSIPKVRRVLKEMADQLSKGDKNVPCHRDLNPGNVIVSGGRYWAIDYDDAGNDSPLLDLAMAGFLHAYTQDENEQLLRAYLGHSPTPQELKQFNLYRHVVIIFKITEMLVKLPENQWDTPLDKIKIPPFEDLLSRIRSGTFSLDDPENQFILCLSGIETVLNTP